MASAAARRLLAQCITGGSPSASASGAMVPGFLERLGGSGWKTPGMLQGFHLAQDENRESKQASCSSSTAPSLPLAPRVPLALMGLQCNNPSLRQPGLLMGSSSPSALGLPTIGHRGFMSSGARRPAMGGLGLGLGLQRGLAPGQPSGMSARSYMTEGQLLGNAFLLATDIMFWSGLIGAVVFRRNLIVMLLATEIVMLACNLNFLFASAYFNDMTGVIMSITITTIAACETAIGLALCVTYFHLRSATDVEALNFLK